jgi:hypothetical protein
MSLVVSFYAMITHMTLSLQETYGDGSARLLRASKAFNREPKVEQELRGFHLRIPRSTLPLPGVARAVLLLIGGKDHGRSEKTAFEISFTFESTRCVFALRKFGAHLNVWLPEDALDSDADAFAARLLDALNRLIKIAETDIFEPAIKKSVEAGELVLMNNAGALRSQYSYFRDGARLGFGARGRLQSPFQESELTPTESDESVTLVHRSLHRAWHEWQMKEFASKEGSFNATAMVNAYFSYLEHYLSLAIAFTPPATSTLSIEKFLGDSWSSKFKAVFDVSRGGNSKSLYDGLIHVAETYRNPLAHGGWDKRGPTASVPLEGIGRVPLMIVGFESTVGFRLDAFDPDGFDEVCALLDQVDDLLASISDGNAEAWISSGLDVHFEDKQRKKYRAATDKFERYLSRNLELWERNTNMDW